MHLRRVFLLVVALVIAVSSSAALAQSSGGPGAVKPNEPAAKKPPAEKPAAGAAGPVEKKAASDPAPVSAEKKTADSTNPAKKKGAGEADVSGEEEEEYDEEDDDEEPPPGKSLCHRYQLGLAVRAGTGYKTIAPYDDGQYCGNKDKRVCGDRQPVWLELSPSFGVTKSLELLIDVRLTLESDFAATKGFYISPGIKYYTTPHGVFKFFATGQLVFDYQDMEESVDLQKAGLASFDFGIRSALGLHFDVHKNFGFYVQGGIIFGFVRWLTFTVDGGAGIQARY